MEKELTQTAYERERWLWEIEGKKKLAAKLCEIRNELESIAKTGRNEMNGKGYDFVEENEVLKKMKSLFYKYKIDLLITGTSKPDVIAYKSDQGKTRFLTTFVLTYVLQDAETGYEKELQIPGQGFDPAEKGMYKAITGAQKYLFLKNFLIPTSDDPENYDDKYDDDEKVTRISKRNKPINKKPITPGQLKYLNNKLIPSYIKKKGITVEQLYERNRITSIEKLSSVNASKMITGIEKVLEIKKEEKDA